MMNRYLKYLVCTGISIFYLLKMDAQTWHEQIQLAEQYAEHGEYQKSADTYRNLTGDYVVFFEIYPEYKQVLQQLKDTKAEKDLIEKAYSLSNKDCQYQVDLALFYLRNEDNKSADKQFSKVLKSLKQQSYKIPVVAQKLTEAKQYSWAKQVYLTGREVSKDPNAFQPEMAALSDRMGDFNGMAESLIQYTLSNPSEINQVELVLGQSIEGNASKQDTLESILLKVIGKNKEAVPAIQLLAWLYNNQGDYASAFDQLRSLDLLQQLDGSAIMNQARLALREKDYRTAIRAYQYILNQGKGHPYYTTAAIELINTQKERILNSPKFTREDLSELKKSYLTLIAQNFNAYTNAVGKIGLADLEARYYFQADTAIVLLKQVVENNSTPKDLLAQAKLDLGDYYIMNDQPWESILLYTQIEKAYKGSPLGEEAKYRNARLSYFKGDFDWALTQLKIIKGNTFELTSNDAIELATFISDNYNQDYLVDKAAMKAFSHMDLLYFQNNLQEADKIADDMLRKYIGHPLQDDIYYMKAKIGIKEQNYQEAEIYLTKLEQEFPKSILADNAVFRLAQLYDNQLQRPDKAKEFYEKILLEYPDSIYTINARKRYRSLRGDAL